MSAQPTSEVGAVLTWPIIHLIQEKCAPVMGTSSSNMGMGCEARFFAGIDPARMRHRSTCRLCVLSLFIQSPFSNRYEHPDPAFLDHSILVFRVGSKMCRRLFWRAP